MGKIECRNVVEKRAAEFIEWRVLFSIHMTAYSSEIRELDLIKNYLFVDLTHLSGGSE